MLDGTYKIQTKMPMGDKGGTLKLVTEGDSIAAQLEAPGLGKMSATGTAQGDSFRFEGTHKVFLLGKINYIVSGRVDGDRLEATCQTSKGDMQIIGTRM